MCVPACLLTYLCMWKQSVYYFVWWWCESVHGILIYLHYHNIEVNVCSFAREENSEIGGSIFFNFSLRFSFYFFNCKLFTCIYSFVRSNTTWKTWNKFVQIALNLIPFVVWKWASKQVFFFDLFVWFFSFSSSPFSFFLFNTFLFIKFQKIGLNEYKMILKQVIFSFFQTNQGTQALF